MKTGINGIELIKSFESLHDGDLKMIGLQPKMCPAEIWTEGYGEAMIDPDTGKFLKGILNKEKAYRLHTINNEQEATARLAISLAKRERLLNSLNLVLTQNQFDACISFIYNLGWGAFLGSTLCKKIKANPNDVTIPVEFQKWTKAGGKILPGLVRRRKAEADLYVK